MEDVREFEDLMKKRLDEIDKEEEIARSSREVVTLDQQSVGRLSRMDALQQQSMAKATQARRVQERKALQLALSRIAAGSYGYCDDCGAEIDLRRLRLNPALTRCIDCARG